MDPNATLTTLRRLTARIHATADAATPDHDAMAQDADTLATLFASLDEWISRGGFLPQEWSSDRVAKTVAKKVMNR